MKEYLLPYTGQEIINKLEAIDSLKEQINSGNSNNNSNCDIAATATGKNIRIDNPAEAPLIGLKADYENQVINGYQLFDSSKLKTPNWSDGATFNEDGSISLGGAKIIINDDGSITIDGNGTVTRDAYILYTYPHAEKLKLIRGGNFYSNYNVTSHPYITFYLDAWGTIQDLSNGLSCTGTFSHSQDSLNYEAAYLKIAICTEKGHTITPCTVKPMIYQDGDGTWEPFTNKQQKVKDLTLDIYGGNLLDYNTWKNIEGVVNGTANFVNNGVELTATAADCYTHYSANHGGVLRIPVIPGQEATLSWSYLGGSGNTVYVFNEGSSTIARTDAANQKLTFTVPSGCKFITFRVGCVNAGTTAVYKNLMLNLGNSALPFENYKPKKSIAINQLMSEDEINSIAQTIKAYNPTTTIVNDCDAQLEVDYFKNNTNGKAVGKILQANVDLKSEIENLKASINQLAVTQIETE